MKIALFQKLSLKTKWLVLNFFSPHHTLPSICGEDEEINNILMPRCQAQEQDNQNNAHFNYHRNKRLVQG